MRHPAFGTLTNQTSVRRVCYRGFLLGIGQACCPRCGCFRFREGELPSHLSQHQLALCSSKGGCYGTISLRATSTQHSATHPLFLGCWASDRCTGS